jgi:hypothetical protein
MAHQQRKKEARDSRKSITRKYASQEQYGESISRENSRTMLRSGRKDIPREDPIKVA